MILVLEHCELNCIHNVMHRKPAQLSEIFKVFPCPVNYSHIIAR
jgi:hypothetical protein